MVIKRYLDGMQFEYLLSVKDEKKQNYIKSRIEGAGNFFKISNPQIDCFGFCLVQQPNSKLRWSDLRARIALWFLHNELYSMIHVIALSTVQRALKAFFQT